MFVEKAQKLALANNLSRMIDSLTYDKDNNMTLVIRIFQKGYEGDNVQRTENYYFFGLKKDAKHMTKYVKQCKAIATLRFLDEDDERSPKSGKVLAAMADEATTKDTEPKLEPAPEVKPEAKPVSKKVAKKKVAKKKAVKKAVKQEPVIDDSIVEEAAKEIPVKQEPAIEVDVPFDKGNAEHMKHFKQVICDSLDAQERKIYKDEIRSLGSSLIKNQVPCTDAEGKMLDSFGKHIAENVTSWLGFADEF
jgi:hypothetical protein